MSFPCTLSVSTSAKIFGFFISDILTNKIALFFQKLTCSLSSQKMHVRIIALKSGSVKDDCLPSSLDWWSFSCWVYKLYKTSLRTSAVANLITTKEPLNQQWDCKLSLDWSNKSLWNSFVILHDLLLRNKIPRVQVINKEEVFFCPMIEQVRHCCNTLRID